MATAATNPNSTTLDSNAINENSGTPGAPEMVADSIAVGVAFALALTIGQRVIGFGRGILFCHLMTDQELGQWSMIWSYLMLLAPLAVLGLPGCFGKFSEHYRQRGQLRTFVTRVSYISLATTLALSGLIIAYPTWFSWILFRDAGEIMMVRILGVSLIVVSAMNFLATLMESLRQVRTVTLMRFINGVAFALIAVLLLMGWGGGAVAATIAFGVSCVAAMIPAIWFLRKYRGSITNHGDPLSQSSMWKRIAPFAVWLWATNLLHNMFEVSDRYMLIHWSNSNVDFAQGSVGQYHSGRVVPLLLVGVASMLGGVLMPYLSQAWEANKQDAAKRQLTWTVKLLSLAFTAGGVLVLLLSPVLFDWVLQGRYNDGLAVLPLTLVYCIWFSLMIVAQDYLWVAEKGKWAAVALAVGLLTNITMNIFLIPTLGLHGAVIATASGNAVTIGLVLWMNHHFGCRVDAGILLCTVLPLTLLLGYIWAAISLIALMVACVATTLIFSNQEKQDALDVLNEKLGRRTDSK